MEIQHDSPDEILGTHPHTAKYAPEVDLGEADWQNAPVSTGSLREGQRIFDLTDASSSDEGDQIVAEFCQAVLPPSEEIDLPTTVLKPPSQRSRLKSQISDFYKKIVSSQPEAYERSSGD